MSHLDRSPLEIPGSALPALELALALPDLPAGSAVELGVFQGRTIRRIAQALPGREVFGFDSFEGLPERWRDGFEAGAFAVRGGALPDVPAGVTLFKGWFDATLPPFAAEQASGGRKIALLHVDCDIYSSTRTAFRVLEPLLQDGTVVVFDELIGYPGWQEHEWRAFREFLAPGAWRAEWLGSLGPGFRSDLHGSEVLGQAREAAACRLHRA
jgi:hypothetical protein